MKTNQRSNPMRELLRQEMGIDAFALDGDAGVLVEAWSDRPRAREGRERQPTVLAS
jgi:hypothetical protein